MSNQSFKVKSGLTLTPVDVTTLVNPQAGDIACDSSDNNKIKRWDGASWVQVGSGGVGGLDFLFTQDFEEATLLDFTQVGLSLDTVDNLHGKVSAKLTHDASVNQYVKQAVDVDPKFRGKNATVQLTVKSAASAGNVVLKITDETGSTDLVVSEQLQLSNNAGGASSSVSFDIPETCLSLSYTITALPEAGSPVTIIDDVYCALTASNMFQSGVVQEADSSIRVDTINGFGSSSTAIRRFLNQIESTGSDIVYVDSPTKGASFTVQSDGVYSISYTDATNNVGGIIILKNPTYPVTGTYTATLASFKNNVLANSFNSYTNNSDTNISWTGELSAGDVIVPFSDGANPGVANRSRFTISKQGSLKQVTVNSDQKITIPTSELMLDTSTSRGTGSESFIVQFENISKLRGDAFEVSNANGTSITVKKNGILNITASVYRVASSELYLTKNQATRTTFPLVSEILANISKSVNEGGADSISWSGSVVSGDVIRLAADSAPSASGANITSFFNLYFQEQDISVSVTNTLPQFSESDSSIRMDTANGYGSTATKVRRLSNTRDNLGTDIQYNPNNDEGVNGASFKILTSGIYHISYSESLPAAAATNPFGISKNASSLITNITSLSSPEVLIISNPQSSGIANGTAVSWSGYLMADDIIRPHTNGGVASINSNVTFTISKVGKPNVTGVDVTPFVNIPQPDTQSSYLYTNTSFSSSNPVTGSLTRSVSSGIFSYNSSTGTYTVLKKGLFNLAYSNSAVGANITATVIILDGNAVAYNNTQSTATASNSCSYTEILLPGQQFYFRPSTNAANNHSISVTAEATSDQVLTQTETFSTDTATLAYSSSYTLSTLQNAPVGTYITFTYAGGSNTRTQTTLNNRPTQTDAEMNANGILLYTRGYTSPSTAAQPVAIAIQIGKGMKGKSLDLYKSAGKTTTGSLDFMNNTASSRIGIQHKEYNESTGIIIIDAGDTYSSSFTSSTFVFSDLTTQSSGYLVINASKNPALTGVNSNIVAARALSTTGVAVSGGTDALVTIGSSDTTILSNMSINSGNSSFIIPETGIYSAKAAIQFISASSAAAAIFSIKVYKNGAYHSTIASKTIDATVTAKQGLQGCDEIRCQKGDYLQFYVNKSAGTGSTSTTSGECFLSVLKLGGVN